LTTVHAEHRSVMFVRPRDPEREVWDGARAGVDGARERCQVDAAYPVAELGDRLPDYLMGATTVTYEFGSRPVLDQAVLAAVAKTRSRARSPRPRPTRLVHPEDAWHEMRLRKTEPELDTMRKAARITADAHLAAMRTARPGQAEYELEALFRQTFLREGAERVAYEPIVASGPNATVLHYVTNRRQMADGDLVLIDAGCEYGYYAADITRTFPVNGRFTAPQREIYEVVLDAQRAVIEASRPGASIDGLHDISLRRLVDGMLRLGLLEGAYDEIVEQERHKRFFMHRTSHWLGMDVHDVGAYYVDGKSRPLEPGMVITVEPGLYVAADDAEAPERFRGIGVRIEDDVLVTPDGHENLTAAVPTAVEEVERACQA
jgi:Xaa-Pro aminopeptidase